MNWVWLPDGSGKVQNVGVVKESASGYEEFIIDGNAIFWSFESTKVFSIYFLFVTNLLAFGRVW